MINLNTVLQRLDKVQRIGNDRYKAICRSERLRGLGRHLGLNFECSATAAHL